MHSPSKTVVLTSSVRSQNEAFNSPVTQKNEIENETTTNLNGVEAIATPEKDSFASFLSQNGLQDASLTEEETRDLKKLSARSRQRHLKNLHILNEDSFIDEELSESVAHVDYFSESVGEEDEGAGGGYHPDESFYREALQQEPLPVERPGLRICLHYRTAVCDGDRKSRIVHVQVRNRFRQAVPEVRPPAGTGAAPETIIKHRDETRNHYIFIIRGPGSPDASGRIRAAG